MFLHMVVVFQIIVTGRRN